MFVYDFKYDDLSKIVYNWLQQNKHNYQIKPSFYVINFDNLSISHRCNLLDPNTMNDITDATESARTIPLGDREHHRQHHQRPSNGRNF